MVNYTSGGELKLDTFSFDEQVWIPPLYIWISFIV